MSGGTRVLHVMEAVRGGTSRHLADLVRHTPGVAHHAALPPPQRSSGRHGPPGGAPYDTAAVAALRQAGAVVHHVDMRREPWHPLNMLAVARVRALARVTGAGILHGHSSVGGAIARLASVGTGAAVVYTPNGVVTAAPYLLAERVLGRLTTCWIAVSASEAALAVERGVAAPGRVVTIPNGIDLSSPPEGADLRALVGVAPTVPLVGCVARLVPQKAPLDFVRVAAAVASHVPDAHFVLVGMGPLQSEVDAAARAAGLDGRWHRLAHLDGAAAALAQLDVFVLASAFEGGPYTPLEALRAGTPVVLTDVVGNRDAVEDGVSGFLRPAGDVEGLAEAVVRLLGDAGLRERFAVAGRARLAERFDVREMGRRLADLYLGVSSGRPS